MPSIGDIEIPIVFEMERSEASPVNEIYPRNSFGNEVDNVLVEHESDVQDVTIIGVVNQELHSSNLSLDEQKKDINSLRGTQKLDNSFKYLDLKGYLLIESVNFTDNFDSDIVNEVEISAKYFPWPQYYPESEP